MTKDEAINLAALAVYEAGDNDPSTGGPDFVRNIFPMIVTVTENGFEELAFEETSERFRIINQRRTASGGRAEGDLR
jgi:proteasome beta subunit